MKFESLSLCEPLLRSLRAAGYKEATPIQQQAIPQIFGGRDIVGCAQTGTGKTAAFALPTLQMLMTPPAQPTGAEVRRKRTGRRVIRSLILAPTRELAGQIADSFATYGKFTGLRHTVVFGGVRQGPQVRALQAGIDILVATPGRLLDLIGQGFVKLAHVEILILDESDQMLDMGFIHDVRKIVGQCPAERQTLMFSATMPKEVRELASQWLRRPFEVKVAPVASTPERVSQTVFFVQKSLKAATLTRFLQITDRSKDVIKSGGEWISSIELENIAVGHPEVTEACVIGVHHPKWDERPLLLIIRAEGSKLDRGGMLEFFEGKIAKWWLPDDVVFVTELPHTATGKLLKAKLREEYGDHVLPTVEAVS